MEKIWNKILNQLMEILKIRKEEEDKVRKSRGYIKK
jgi:hypothetical protein